MSKPKHPRSVAETEALAITYRAFLERLPG
jgi:hypothetical protein